MHTTAIVRTVALASLSAFLMVACASDDSAQPVADTTIDVESLSTTPVTDAMSSVPGDPATNVTTDPDEGRPTTGTGVLTIEDGTTYEFEMTRCLTSNNAPDDFLWIPVTTSSVRPPMGSVRLAVIRAALEEPTVGAGDLGGDFDENGVNPAIAYVFSEDDSTIVLDGDSLTGDLAISNLGGDPVHGETTTVTLRVTC